MERLNKNALFAILINFLWVFVGCDSTPQSTTAVVKETRDPKASVAPKQKPVRFSAGAKNSASVTQEKQVEEALPEQDSVSEDSEVESEEQTEVVAVWDAEREELRKNIKSEIDIIETKIDELKGEIDGAGPDVRTRCQRAISELRYERAKLNGQLKRLGSANKENWEKLKSRITNAVQATDERVSQVSDQASR